MTERHRLEDLGVITQMLSDLCEHELFDWNEGKRCKDTSDWFMSLDEEKKCDLIHKLAYQISEVKDLLLKAWCIGRWGFKEED